MSSKPVVKFYRQLLLANQRRKLSSKKLTLKTYGMFLAIKSNRFDFKTYFSLKDCAYNKPLHLADLITNTCRLKEPKCLCASLKPLKKEIKLVQDGLIKITDALWKLISDLTGCIIPLVPKKCQDSPYRTITGECNNRKNPSLGATNTSYKRFLPAAYEDVYDLPPGWTDKLWNGFYLPLVRRVSNLIVRAEQWTKDSERSIWFMQMGQQIAHEITLSLPSPTKTDFYDRSNCTTNCIREEPCFPIKIPPNDPKNHSACIPFIRSAPVCNLESPKREQTNGVTAFIDGSAIYGSDNQTAEELRDHTNDLGLLKVNMNYTDNGHPYLPFDPNSGGACVNGTPCFKAGDFRNSQQPFIMVSQTLWLRLHNNAATQLHKLNPTWKGDTLYEEARKFVGGVMQKIVFYDWLPLMLGSKMAEFLPEYTSYRESLNPQLANGFTLAHRIGHTLVPTTVYWLNTNYEVTSQEPLHKTFNAPSFIVNNGGIDPVARGMMVNLAKLNLQNQMMTDELREFLFLLQTKLGFDLASFNMQRSNDHGLPGYFDWRRFCNLPAPRDVNELSLVLQNKELANELMKLYGTTKNINFWIGAISEPLVPGGRCGELLACILGHQFRDLRDADRYYFENPGVFTKEQMESIKHVTMSHITCENSNIGEVPENVFLANDPNDFVKCDKLEKMDFNPWKM
ncbi:myeloperoxidase-like [Pelobates fuscus]|uniref:myeloperoxidase-like n=1 Tax=Pelobates fuscus TaxID=191477 RepID=UPI002FE484BA